MATKEELDHLRELYNEKAQRNWAPDARSFAVYDEPEMMSYTQLVDPSAMPTQDIKRVVFERLPLYHEGQRIGWIVTTSDGYFIGIAK